MQTNNVAALNGNVFSRIREAGSGAVQRMQQQVISRGSAAVFVVLSLLIITALIAFIIIRLKSVNMQGTAIITEPMKLYSMSKQIRVDQSAIPPTVNGQEYSFSFWLYLVDFQPTSDGPQLVFMRSSDGSSVGGSNPMVAFLGNTNTLIVSARTNAAKGSAQKPEEILKSETSGYLQAKIDYFPLQRWVNVIAITKDDSLSIYMNGSLYTVSNVSDLMTTTAGKQQLQARPVFAASTGSLFVGSAGVSDVRESRSFIAQFRFYNYALTQKDINNIYKSGPSSSTLLAKLGLVGYGLRSPIYRVE